jgi:hypothetical protein
MPTDILTYSDCDDYTYCPLIEGSRQMFRLSSWELGLEIAKQVGEIWSPIHDDPYMIVLGENRKFTDSPYIKSYDRDTMSVSHEVWLHFRRTVPKAVQEIIGPHFKYSQIQLLKAIRFCPELMELARSCLPLFWLVVEKNSDVNVLSSWDFVRLLRLRRKEILARLGNVGTESSVRLMSKMKMDCFSDEDFFNLKDVMRSAEKIFLLRHFKVIAKAHLFAAAHHPELLGYSFVRNELMRKNTSTGAINHLVSLYKDTCNMADTLHKENMVDFFNTIKSFQKLKRRHDALAEEMNVNGRNTSIFEKLLDTYGQERFPPAPIPGSQTIQPICSLPELAREGQEMQNCILTYGRHIYEGSFFCYKILKPERGTVGLDLTQGIPRIVEIQLKKNNTPSPATVLAVEEWLQFMQKALSELENREKNI